MDPLIVRLPSSGVFGANNPVFLNRGVEADDFIDDELLPQDAVDETLDIFDVALFMVLLLLNFSSPWNDVLGVTKVDEILKLSLLLL